MYSVIDIYMYSQHIVTVTNAEVTSSHLNYISDTWCI